MQCWSMSTKITTNNETAMLSIQYSQFRKGTEGGLRCTSLPTLGQEKALCDSDLIFPFPISAATCQLVTCWEKTLWVQENLRKLITLFSKYVSDVSEGRCKPWTFFWALNKRWLWWRYFIFKRKYSLSANFKDYSQRCCYVWISIIESAASFFLI